MLLWAQLDKPVQETSHTYHITITHYSNFKNKSSKLTPQKKKKRNLQNSKLSKDLCLISNHTHKLQHTQPQGFGLVVGLRFKGLLPPKVHILNFTRAINSLGLVHMEKMLQL